MNISIDIGVESSRRINLKSGTKISEMDQCACFRFISYQAFQFILQIGRRGHCFVSFMVFTDSMSLNSIVLEDEELN